LHTCALHVQPQQRAASIDTPLHGLLPYSHIDHVHPDAVIALAAASSGESASREVWRGAVGWLPLAAARIRSGITLRDYVAQLRGCAAWYWRATVSFAGARPRVPVMRIRFNWSAMPRATSMSASRGGAAFGGARIPSLPQAERLRLAAEIMPKLRGLMSGESAKIGHLSADPETLEFVCSKDFARLAALGTSCPDHFLRTKIWPLTLDENSGSRTTLTSEESLSEYRAKYAPTTVVAQPQATPRCGTPIRSSSWCPDSAASHSRSTRPRRGWPPNSYGNAINVMRGAESIGRYIGSR